EAGEERGERITLIRLRLVGDNRHMDPLPWPNTVAAELGTSSASSPGTVKSHSEAASEVLMASIVGPPNPTASESGPACIRRGPVDLHRTQFEVNPGVIHAARRSSDQPLSTT